MIKWGEDEMLYDCGGVNGHKPKYSCRFMGLEMPGT